MTPEQLNTALTAKARTAATDATDAALAAGRARQELAGTRQLIAGARAARFPGAHTAVLEALVDPEQTLAAAAEAAAAAADVRRAAAHTAVDQVGSVHLQLQAGGAAGTFYQPPTTGAAAGPGPAGPADAADGVDQEVARAYADADARLAGRFHDESYHRDRTALVVTLLRRRLDPDTFRRWYRTHAAAETSRQQTQAVLAAHTDRWTTLVRQRRTVRAKHTARAARPPERVHTVHRDGHRVQVRTRCTDGGVRVAGPPERRLTRRLRKGTHR